jgi:uncharacterized repeat protein (TIGR03806 family)
MRRVLVLALGVALLYACGDDAETPGSGPGGPDDGGADASFPDGVAPPPGDGSSGGIDTGPPPKPSAYGLDQRPSNPTCVAQPRPPIDSPVTLQRVWSGLSFNSPIYATQAPGDPNHFYVVERGGTVRAFLTTATTQADVTTLVTLANINENGEGGLLGMAFHPNWQTNHEAYLSYTRNGKAGDPSPPSSCGVGTTDIFTSAIARFKSADGGATLTATPDEVLKLGQPFSNHDGGNIQFGLDGMLYIGFGDGGAGNDPCGSGQDLSSMFGKVLRIDINAGAGQYNIPPDNPFVGTAGAAKEIWSYGHRNPWRWSFDSATGDLWLGEVGQDTWEEIDHVHKGGNYGWNTCEGFHKRGSTTALCNTPGLIDPIVEHPRSEAQSIIGGYVYRGSALPTLVGTYIYGDYVTGNIWALEYDTSNNPTPKVIANLPGQTLVSFAQGNDGEVYTVQISGEIRKVVPSGPPAPNNFPTLLSKTGCTDPNDATKPASGAIPYDVISPLWSDGAKKDRWFALPDGKTITIGADNDWDLPIGSVAMKTFWVNGKRVETRHFMRHSDGGWAGYTYEWNDQGTDAALLPAGKTKSLGTQTWTYPSRTQCMQCHSVAAGGTIGLETWQLNKDATYPSTNRLSNQLATLDHIGMFSAPLGQPPSALPKLPDPGGADPVDTRARSYLHANCSHCHRPQGGGQGTMDLRFGQTFKATVTCNAAPTQGQVEGVTNAKILTPTDPGHSIISLRVHANDSKRMPPVAVSIVDPLGSKLIDDWITSVTTCP